MVIQSGRADLVLGRQVFVFGFHDADLGYINSSVIGGSGKERGLKSTQYGVFSVVSCPDGVTNRPGNFVRTTGVQLSSIYIGHQNHMGFSPAEKRSRL